MEWIDIFIKLLKKHALPAPFVYQHDAVKSVTIIEFKDGKQAYRTTVKP